VFGNQQPALHMLVKAAYFESHGLHFDALASFDQALALAPEVND